MDVKDQLILEVERVIEMREHELAELQPYNHTATMFMEDRDIGMRAAKIYMLEREIKQLKNFRAGFEWIGKEPPTSTR